MEVRGYVICRYEGQRTPMVRSEIAWFTLRRGETSTAWRRTVPCEPIRVESSRGPVLTMASTRTCVHRKSRELL